MAIVFEKGRDLNQGIRQGGGAILNALINRFEQQRNDQSLLNSIFNQGSEERGFPQQRKSSPIDEAKSLQSNNVSLISGVPSDPPVKDQNRKAPLEQMDFQQYGNESTALRPELPGSGLPRDHVQAAEAVNREQGPKRGFADIEESDLERLIAAGSPQLRSLAENEKKRRRADERIASVKNKPFEKRLSDLRVAVPEQQQALSRIEEAMKSKDLASFRNRVGNTFGYDFLKSKSSIELQSAVKQFFVADLKGLGSGRLNQFIERQVLDALPKAGYDPEANRKIVDSLRFKVDVAKKEVEIADNLAEAYEFQGRGIPSNFENQVSRQLKDYVTYRQKELANDLSRVSKIEEKRNNEIESDASPGEVAVYSPNGERGFIKKSDLNKALEKGYKKI